MDNRSDIDSEMIPFTIKGLVDMVMKKKSLDFHDALYYTYSSSLAKRLLDKSAKMWYLSTLALYDMLEKEKNEIRRNEGKNPRTMLFKVFCMENYSRIKNLPVISVLHLFSEADVFGFLDETFETLHTQSTAYIIDTISAYIRNKTKKR